MKNKILITGISILLTLLGGELLLRTYRIVKRGSLNKNVALQGDEQRVLFEFSSNLGWLGKKNLTGRLVASEFNVEVKSNESGFREQSFKTIQETAKKIVVLGDSSVWGYGIPESKRMTNLLEERLRLRESVEVINLGISGYGTDQKLLSYLYYGRVWHPEVVIIVIDNNDFSENTRSIQYEHNKPYFTLNDSDELELHRVQDNNKSIKLTSILLQFILNKINKLNFKPPPSQPVLDDQSTKLTLEIIKKLITLIKSDGSGPYVLFLPTKCEVNQNNKCVFTQARSSQNLIDKNIVIDVYQPFTNSLQELYFKTDPHINEQGNSLMANVIFERLIEDGF